MKRAVFLYGLLALVAVAVGGGLRPRARAVARAAEPERALFGSYPTRNMISEETGLPAKWDVKTGANVKWSQPAGSQTYAGPVVADGKVFLGTNNEGERNPKIKGDKGVVMAFRAADGEFLWQMVTDKLPSGRVNDWPQQGVCSTPFVEGKRLYYTSNQARIVCLDTEGLKDGKNDGVTTEKYKDDGDGDVIWEFDLMGELDVFPHNLAASSPMVVGDIVYVTTGNGVDESHINIPSPQAPSFVALDKNTGKLVWESNLPGENIIHGNWSNASFGTVKGKPQVVFGGGDGWVYSFEPKTGQLLWKFDANPKGSVYALGARGTKNDIISSPVIFDDRVFIGVGQDPEHGEGVGNLWSIDASLSGDITEKAAVWHRGGEDFRRTISTVAIKDGVVYAANLSGFFYALDEKTGKPYWEHDMFAAVWGSPYVADGKVYLGDEDGDVTVFKAGKTKEVLAEMNMGNAVYTTPFAKDGVLYVLSRNRLFAIQEGAKSEPAKKGD
jgi:outer membrane protein assembly factor BamB